MFQKLHTKNIKRSTMLYGIQVIVFFLIVKYISCVDTDGCKGEICRKSLAIPLLDNLKAPLVANLDITQFNKQLRGYITEQIKQGVEQAKKEIRGEMKALVDTFEDAHENDNSTAEVKDELMNLNQQLIKTQDEIHNLKSFHASFTSQINAAVKRVSTNEEKVPMVNDKLRNLEGDLSSIRSAITSVESRQNSMSSDISSALRRLTANEKRVGFTACIRNEDESTKSGGQPIPFIHAETRYNVDTSSITSNGKFTVKTNGLYLISVSIRSRTNNAYFAIYDGSTKLAYGYTAEHDGVDTYVHSGTIDVVRYFVNGDIITVKPWKTMYIDAWSCLTVVKIK